jgi:hypothetical protein
MKIGLAVVVLLVVAIFALCAFALMPRAEAQPPARNLKELLFADDPLEKSAELGRGEKPPAESPFRGFAAAQSLVRAGKVEEAKKELRPLLTNPETRIQLWAWRALRELGEKPDPQTGDPVRGVVCELSNEAGVGTLAVYADGRARWLGGQGAVTVWEAPGQDAGIDQGIRKLLGAGAPLVRSAPARDQHLESTLAKDHFRVSVLTYGGVHVVEAFGPDIDEAHALAPALLASTPVIQALARQTDGAKKSGAP